MKLELTYWNRTAKKKVHITSDGAKTIELDKSLCKDKSIEEFYVTIVRDIEAYTNESGLELQYFLLGPNGGEAQFWKKNE